MINANFLSWGFYYASYRIRGICINSITYKRETDVYKCKILYASCSFVVHALHYRICQKMETGKARGSLCRLSSSSILLLPSCATQHVLATTVAFSNMPEGKSISLLQALREARVVINVITAERNDPMVWNVNCSIKRLWRAALDSLFSRIYIPLRKANVCRMRPLATSIKVKK